MLRYTQQYTKKASLPSSLIDFVALPFSHRKAAASLWPSPQITSVLVTPESLSPSSSTREVVLGHHLDCKYSIYINW